MGGNKVNKWRRTYVIGVDPQKLCVEREGGVELGEGVVYAGEEEEGWGMRPIFPSPSCHDTVESVFRESSE